MKRTIQLLAPPVLFVALLEVMLRLIDPLGAWAYLSDQAMLHRDALRDHERGYVFTLGFYQGHGWSVWIEDDYTRHVPDSGDGDCTIAFIGDSYTFGFGVSDDETWVNRLAREFPAVRFINAGVPGYNIELVERSMQAYPADGYVYFVFDNDLEVTPVLRPPAGPDARFYHRHETAIGYYGFVLRVLITGESPEQDRGAFDERLSMLIERDDVLLFGFDDNPVFENYSAVHLIPRPDRISAVDDHPTVAGHRMMAEEMEGKVDSFVRTEC